MQPISTLFLSGVLRGIPATLLALGGVLVLRQWALHLVRKVLWPGWQYALLAGGIMVLSTLTAFIVGNPYSIGTTGMQAIICAEFMGIALVQMLVIHRKGRSVRRMIPIAAAAVGAIVLFGLVPMAASHERAAEVSRVALWILPLAMIWLLDNPAHYFLDPKVVGNSFRDLSWRYAAVRYAVLLIVALIFCVVFFGPEECLHALKSFISKTS